MRVRVLYFAVFRERLRRDEEDLDLPSGANVADAITALAARHADIYSGYLTRGATIEDLRQRLVDFDAMCVEVGRDPAAIGRSRGAFVRPFEPAASRPGNLSGTTEEIADRIRELRHAGYNRVELTWQPGTMEALEALAPVVKSIRAD